MHGLLAAVVLTAFAATPSAAKDPAPTDKDVREGIEKIRAYLRKQQNKDGHWDRPEPDGSKHTTGYQYGGTTAIVCYALVASGESYQSPTLRRGIDWLMGQDLKGTYARALRAHLYAQLPPDRFHERLVQDVKWLEGVAMKPVEKTGGTSFDYMAAADGKSWSNSRGQYGLLGLWEGSKRGVAIDPRTWAGLQKHWEFTQQKDGGWLYNYTHHKFSTVAMTAAGVTAMHVLRDTHHRGAFRRPGVTPTHPVQRSIDRGMAFLDQHFQPDLDKPGRNKSFLAYHLYGIERVGIASGATRFNGMDWYAAGAAEILDNIGRDGSVKLSGSGLSGGAPDAAFALLFLSRGAVPVAVSKLKFDEHWNNRPHDVAGFTQWLSVKGERQLNWQFVTIDSDPETWLTAPLLYIASHEPLRLNAAQTAKLKRYMDLGGMIVVIDEGPRVLSREMADTLAGLYPDLTLEPAGSNHPIFNFIYAVPARAVEARVLSNGVRPLAVVVSQDIVWPLHNEEDGDAQKLMANLWLYAAERGRAKPRLAALHKPGKRPEPKREVTVLRLKHAAGWDAEPAAWERFADWAVREHALKVTVKTVEAADLPADGEGFVHVGGTAPLRLNGAETAALVAFVKAGGVVLFENVGGTSTFGGDAVKWTRQHVNNLFPARVMPTDPEVTAAGKDHAASAVTYRLSAVLRGVGLQGLNLLKIEPSEGKGRVYITFDDLSYAWLDQPVWGVLGYDTDSARRIMLNLLLHHTGEDDDD